MPPQSDPPGQRDVLAQVARTLEDQLPEGWDLASVLEPGGSMPPADALLTVTAPDGTAARFIVEAKTNLDPKNALFALEQLLSYRAGLPGDPDESRPVPLLISSFISRRAQELIAEAGASYADATGNVRLRSDRPAIFINSRGAASNPWRESRDRQTTTLRGVPAARVVRALCDWKPPIKATDLASRAETSVGATYRVLDLLDREALITRRGKGEVVTADWPDILRRWSQDYDFASRNRTAAFIAARGLEDVLNRLRSGPSARFAVTGSLAAAPYAPYAESRLGAIYVDDIDRTATELGVSPAGFGVNLVLAEPFDDVVYQRTVMRDGVVYTAPSQTAVDLLTGPGRNPSEGEELIRWMEDNEPVWRI